MLQRHAVQILHGNECLPILLADVINSADVRMVQRGCRLRFTLETAQSLRIFRHIIGQELERDKAPQSGVLSLIDDTHPTTAKSLQNVVVRNGLANHSEGAAQVASSYGRAMRESTNPASKSRRSKKNCHGFSQSPRINQSVCSDP